MTLYFKVRQILLKKCDNHFLTKCNKNLLQNGSGCLFQNATVLSQIVTVITDCMYFITKYVVYYKMCRCNDIESKKC